MAKTVERGLPRGPWVLVVGMHRSGTSALTGALGRLGLALPAPDDLVAGRYDNPVHYESQALNALNDAILAALGRELERTARARPGLGSLGGGPRSRHATLARAARRAFPVRGPVRVEGPAPVLAPAVVESAAPAACRHRVRMAVPHAVARSLRARQGFPLSLGLALWERYTRAALTALAGHAGYVLRYEELLADPRAALRPVGPLARHGRRDRHWRPTTRPCPPRRSNVSGELAGPDGDGDERFLWSSATPSRR